MGDVARTARGAPGRLRQEDCSSQGLRCMQCEDNHSCVVKECALGQDLCRTTVLREWEDGDELEVEVRDCAHYEKTNRTMSYRVNSKIISLAEVVCATDVCNRMRPGARRVAFPPGRHLECMSCSSLDQSCERGREQSLQCRHPREQCVDVVTLQSAEILTLQDFPPNGFRCYSCEGNSTHGCSSEETSLLDCRGPMDRCLEATGLDVLANRTYTVRGCATASWCQGSHVADAFLLAHLNVSCCDGSACNDPRSGAPRPDPARLGFIVCLLLTGRLWGALLSA